MHAAPTGSSVLLRTRGAGGRWRARALWDSSYDWANFSVTAHRGHTTVFVGATKSLQVLVRSQER